MNRSGSTSSGAEPFLLPGEELALVEKAPLHRRYQLLRSAQIVRGVRLAVAAQSDAGAVVKIVVPDRIDAEAAVRRGAHQPGLLGFVLGDHDGLAAAASLAHSPRDLGQEMRCRTIEDLLRRVQAQAVEMVLVDPVARIANEVFPDWRGVRPVEV